MEPERSRSHHAVLHVDFVLSTLTKVKALRVSAVTSDMDPSRDKQVNLAWVTFSFTCGSHANFLCSLFKLHWDIEENQS